MQETMQAVRALHDMLIKKNDRYDVLVSEAQRKLASLESREADVLAKEQKVAIREEKCGMVENANALRIEASDLLRKAKEKVEAAQLEAKNITEICAKMLREAEIESKNAKSDLQAVREMEKKLKSERDALEIEKKSYKAQLLKEVTGGK